MPDILHKVGIKSAPSEAYRALTTLAGLDGWWTTTTSGDPGRGGTLQFRFGTRGEIDMKVLELEPAKRVRWEVIRGPQEWLGTHVVFDLKPEGDVTGVLFKHEGWRAATETMHHCSTKWATFLLSLKSLIETGEGTPFPRDVHVGATD